MTEKGILYFKFMLIRILLEVTDENNLFYFDLII